MRYGNRAHVQGNKRNLMECNKNPTKKTSTSMRPLRRPALSKTDIVECTGTYFSVSPGFDFR